MRAIREDDPDVVRRQGMEWVIRLMSGTASSVDLDALEMWRKLSAAHEQAFQDALHVWQVAGVAAKELLADDAAPAVLPHPSVVASRRPVLGRRALLGGAVAAAAAVAVVGAAPSLGLLPTFGEMTADFTTPTGGRRTVTLADRVTLDLNTRTSLSWISKDADNPVVKLVAGEAAFGADFEGARKLTVLAANGRIEARRARFNVRDFGGRIAVSAVEGEVDVVMRDQPVAITARKQVVYDAKGARPPSAFDPEVVTAWQNGLIIFHERPLAEVIDEVGRYWPGKIVLTNDEVGKRVVNGVFHLDKLDGVFSQMESLGASVTRLPAGIVLIG